MGIIIFQMKFWKKLSVCDEIDNKTPFLSRVMSKKAVTECNVENKEEIMEEEDIKTATGILANSPILEIFVSIIRKRNSK